MPVSIASVQVDFLISKAAAGKEARRVPGSSGDVFINSQEAVRTSRKCLRRGTFLTGVQTSVAGRIL